jgi:ABC-type polysaccharide/polyol phosphate export permease
MAVPIVFGGIMLSRYKKYKFLFSILVKRDFNKKYNRTVFGALWSLLSPLMMVGTQAIIFTYFFGRTTPHYIVYMLIGNLVYSFFRDATTGGMVALENNAAIITKIRVPKYMFVFSKNVTSVINMLITLSLLIPFCLIDHLAFTWKFLFIVYPLLCLTAFNIGASLLLSGIYVFFRDTRYFYDIFCTIVMYFSAIFYSVEALGERVASLIQYNPVYCYIFYVRKLVIDAEFPSLKQTLLCFGYAAVMLGIGMLFYRIKNKSYIYNL